MVMLKKFSLAASMLLIPLVSHAQVAGTWQWQLGATTIEPNVTSGALTAPAPGLTTADVGGDTQPTLQVSYRYNDHWSVAVPLGLGFRHKLYGDGAIAGVGQIGSVRALPITVFGRYHFGEASGSVRPYAALGASYVKFDDAQGSATLNGINPINPVGGSTGLKVDSKFALNVGLGVTVQAEGGWFVDAFYGKTFLKTRTHLSTGQTMDATLDPTMLTLGVGRSF
jgi:outer membrane protein